METLSYKDSGVNIDNGNKLVNEIKPIVKKTHRPEVMGSLGGFGGLFALDKKYKNPILVSGTDGVGTKLKLAQAANDHSTIGIDLVAMCVNDILTLGAEPLFFLDYFATGHLAVNTAKTVISSIAEGCLQAGCALIGGETAEMPGMYRGEDYDIAGFCVGVVEKSALIDAKNVNAGDVLIALPSSGPHSNGYSLIRNVLETSQTSLNKKFQEKTLAEILLRPTKIYTKAVLNLLSEIRVNAMAHITGGGLLENIPRFLPENCYARIQKDSWDIPEIFSWLQSTGNIPMSEMYRTFNCGVGFVLCVPQKNASMCISLLEKSGESPWIIGELAQRNAKQQAVEFI